MATDTVGGLEMLLKGELAQPAQEAISTVPIGMLSNPMDIFRWHLADCLVNILHCDIESALEAIQTSHETGNGDLVVILPRLKLPDGPASPQELGSELVRQFPSSPLDLFPVLDGIHLRFFFSSKILPCLVLPSVGACGASYGFTSQAGLPDPEAPKPRRKKLLIEFASPNITTQSHGAHLRSAILGAHIAALYERMGWDVTRVNYLGDWGLQIGLLGAGWERFGNDDALGTDPLRHLLDVYSRIEAEFRPELEERARIRAAGGDPAELEARQEAIETQGLHAERDAWFKRLEAGDEEAIKTWQRFRNLTIEQYRTLYSRLAIEFDEYAGESQVSATSIAAAEAALKDKGLYEDNHGAGTIDYRKHGGTKGMGTGTLRFRAGTTTYLLRDIGALLDRAEQHGFDKMIYVVAAEQDTHFQRLFKAVELMGRSDIASKVQHVHFGKTQEPHPREQEDGNPPMQLLDDILRQAETAAGELLKVDHRGAALLLVDGAAGKVAAGALIVQSLHCKRDGQLSIDLTRAMTFDGETGPYLQYWHGRLCRLLDGAAGPAAVSYSAIDGDVHGDLLRVLARFPDTIQAAFKTLEPGALLTSLFQLVDEASALLGGDGEEAPAMTTGGDVAVYAAVRQVLENGLRVLGIPTLSV